MRSSAEPGRSITPEATARMKGVNSTRFPGPTPLDNFESVEESYVSRSSYRLEDR